MRGYMTQKGVNLIAKLNTAGDILEITNVWGSNSPAPPTSYADMTDIGPHDIPLSVVGIIQYEPSAKLHTKIYFDNLQLNSPYTVTEVGLFANDPDEGEILFCVIPFYTSPQLIPESPSQAGVRFEFTGKIDVEVSLSPNIEIIVNGSMVFLTIEEAMKLFWILGHKYAATEIFETTGTTTEEWQRIQDDRIAQILQILESGTTAGFIVEMPTLVDQPYNWAILNFSGYRNPLNGAIEA